jgi:hypothetical protein
MILIFLKDLSGHITPLHITSSSELYHSVYTLFPTRLKLFKGESEVDDTTLLEEGDVLSILLLEDKETVRIYIHQSCYTSWSEPYLRRYEVRWWDNSYHYDTLFLFYEESHNKFYSTKDICILHQDPLGEDPDQVSKNTDSFYKLEDLFEDELSRIADYSLRQYLLHKCLEDWRKNFVS